MLSNAESASSKAGRNLARHSMEPAMRKRFLLLLGALFAAFSVAAPLPYDESADAKAAVQRALSAAKESRIPVFVIFGANWCEDCRALDLALKSGRNAELIDRKSTRLNS